MSTQAPFNPLIDLSPMKELVNSLTDSDAAALTNPDTRAGQTKQSTQAMLVQAPVVKAITAPTVWMQPESAPASRKRQVGLFALVVFIHALALYMLTQVQPSEKEIAPLSLQVAIIAESRSEPEQRLPPMPLPQQPTITLPTEPVFLTADPETTSITVETHQVEATVSAATGTPKLVSSVEYVREPHPKYPPTARALKQRGTVMLRVLVDTEGRAHEVNVHRSSGYRALDDAARSAVLEAQFQPYRENGHALSVYVFVPIEFGAA